MIRTLTLGRSLPVLCLALTSAAALVACNKDKVNDTPASLTLERIGGFTHDGGTSAAEVTAFDPLSKRLFVVNGALGSVDVLDLSNPAAPTLVRRLASAELGVGLGGANSVAVHNGIVAVALEAVPKTANGKVVFINAASLSVLNAVTVGALPDMLTFTPDGSKLVVANEGEPNSYAQADSVDPEGSVSVVSLAPFTASATSITATVTPVTFTALNSQQASLRSAGVRLFGPGATVAQDLEPEYVTVSADSRTAYVTLQENNAIATVNLVDATVTSLRALGLKDHALAGAGMDVSDEDGVVNSNSGSPAIKIAQVPVKGMYQPDAVASYQVGGFTYLVTANEGDAREYKGVNAVDREDPRLRDYCTNGLDPAVFPDAANQLLDSNLGRLRITTFPNGDRTGKNAQGQCNELLAFGARSLSIWRADTLAQVFDSGDQLEQATKALPNALFNTSHDNNALDSRSPAKGPEPEGVTLGVFGRKTYAFVGLERVGGIMVYDVTNPAAPAVVTYLNPRNGATGDRGPEGLTFVPAAQSPNGKALLIVGHEVSGTTAIFQVNPQF